MNINKWFLLLLSYFVLTLFSCHQPPESKGTLIIPVPLKQELHNGVFTINSQTKIICSNQEEIVKVAGYLSETIGQHCPFQPQVVAMEVVDYSDQDIVLLLDGTCTELNDEGYQLQVRRRGVEIHANKPVGLFYGVQSLLQLFPLSFYEGSISDKIEVHGVQITDEPRFPYRGMHLDVCRHMFPVAFIKKYIDLLAMYKFNTFHWHLTEDQGWRIEIKQYPKLTEIGAYRDSTVVGHGGNQSLKYDGASYGGFYTQDEIREVVQYASDRMITIIPEIEMPGHSLAALAAYPELGCTDGPFQVATTWGVFEDICCPKEETFTFLENVLTEVMALFPGTYIHIGGDEAPKDRWKESAFCQQLMKEQGLKNEHELQSYFIRRIETFLNSKGRKLIGWDEILDGGLSPNATVMSWRGEAGGIAAAQQGHDAIMTPGGYCYFDHYQADPETEPLAIGGFTTLKKVYGYEPVPEILTESQAVHILGAQANVWTEYILSPEQVEYMVLPRMAALAEVDWSQPTNKNWEDFYQRILSHYKVYEALGYQFSRGSYRVIIETKPETTGGWNIVLETEIPEADIYFTSDGNDPDMNSSIYEKPFLIDQSSTIKAVVFENGSMKGVISKQEINLHKAVNAKLTLITKPDSSFARGDASKLVDGLLGGNNFKDGHWLGYNGVDMEFELELLHPDTISTISMRFYRDQPDWIFFPLEWRVDFMYDDSLIFVTGKFCISVEAQNDTVAIQEIKVQLNPQLRIKLGIKVTSLKKNPPWHPGAGENTWIFVDEISVN